MFFDHTDIQEVVKSYSESLDPKITPLWRHIWLSHAEPWSLGPAGGVSVQLEPLCPLAALCAGLLAHCRGDQSGREGPQKAELSHLGFRIQDSG